VFFLEVLGLELKAFGLLAQNTFSVETITDIKAQMKIN
jgi:hypothetical protein